MRQTLFILSLLITLTASSYAQTPDYGYPTNPDLTSTSSNTILPVGGAFNVGELGNAIYTIPIEVPMGINGMQPDLSLTYNSLAGNGMCGLGFNISGLSAISRVSGNYYYDGKTSDMVANSGYVALSMDGQRLINGSNGKYYIENDPNTDITLKNDTITVKQNSKTLKYRKINSNYQVYYLFAVTDNFGNRISYNYRTENNCVYPSTITYGVGTGAVTISFVYETRTDVVNCFNKIPFQIKKRLCRIDIKKNAALWRSYNLLYSYSNGFSKISQIVEKNSKGEQKYPTEFSWGSSLTSAFSNKITVLNSSEFSYEDVDIIPGDFNNDGIDDIAFVDSHYAYLYLFDNNSSLIFYKKIELAKDMNYDKRLPDLLKYIVASQFAADIDGDGRSELLVVSQPFLSKSNKGLNKISYDVSIKAYRPMGGSEFDFRFGFKEPEMPAVAIGDFYANGKPRLLCAGKTKNQDGKYIIYLQGFGNNIYSTLYDYIPVTLTERPEGVLNGDFDGDGLLDILVITNVSSTIFWNKGYEKRSDLVFSDSYKTSIPKISTDCAIIRVGDFDGDGVSEILYNVKGESTFNILKNNGNRSFTSIIAIDLTGIYDITDSQKDDDQFCVEVTDFNCDGKADLLVSKAMFKHPKHKSYYRHSKNYDFWLKSEGNKFSVAYKREWDGDVAHIYYNFVTGDFNGDGYQEVLRVDVSGKLYLYQPFYSNSYSNPYNKITRISEFNGRFLSIDYGNLTDPKIYSNAGIVKYPMVEVAYPLSVVSSTTQYNGVAPSMTTNYKYKYLLTHLQGKGILGYEYREVWQPELLKSTITMVDEWNKDYYVPQSVRTTSMGTWSESKDVEWSFSELSGKRYFAYPSTVTEKKHYGKKCVTTNTYDTKHGYILSSKTVFGDKSYKLQKYQNYVMAGGIYQPGLVVTEQKHPDDPNVFSTQKYFEYNTQKGYVTKSVENYNTDFALTTLYKYDKYGNNTEQSTFGKGTDTLSTIYKYDGSRRLVTEKRSKPLNKLTKCTYDQFDNLIAETDATDNANPMKTTFKYDAWDLNTETIFPDSTKQSTIRGWNGTKFFVATLGSAIPWSKTLYDNAGHVVKEEKLGLVSSMSSQNISTEYTYDIHGKPTKIVSKAGSYEETTINRYDYYGSLMEHTDNAHAITYRYSANKTEVTDNGRKTVTEYDDWGNVKSISMPDESTVNYKYFSNGKVKTITSLGATVSFQYYPNGLRKSITDSDAGTESYVYDSFGRTIKQTRGNVVTENVYHNGLLTQSKCGGITTKYNYDKKKRLTKLYNATSAITYAYDKYDRMTKETYSIDSRNFTYQYSYNDDGLLASKIFPDKSEERYSYKAGIHTNTNLVGKCSWTLYYDNYAKDGRHSTEITGGVFKDSYFNPDNTLKYVTFGSPNGGNSSDRIDYTYDRFQNIISRKGKYSDTETFKYDASDRLTNINDNYEYQYAANGNILYQTGIGEYEYKASQPHAVSSIDNENGAVKSLEQTVTYTPFRKPETITDDSNPDSIKTYTIYYSPDNERIKSVYKCNKDNVTTYYLPDYEEENANGVVTSRHYVFSDFGNLAAVVFKKGDKSDTYYAITDNVGSVLKLVDDKVKSKYEATYTPFGVRTIEKNTLGYNFPRGFTMHEHLDQFSLINANARLYDPYLAQFLSPDPLIQDPTNSQNFNRFSYCLNNPLKYTDPTGEFWWGWLPYAIGGVCGGIQGYNIGESAGLNVGGKIATTFFGAGIGAASAGLGNYVSSANAVMSNTLGLMAGSFSNSFGMLMLGGMCGQNIPISMSFGIGSVSLDENGLQFGYLGKKGNSPCENLGYGLGAMANLSDFLMGTNAQNVDLITYHSGFSGHSAIVESGTETGMAIGVVIDANGNEVYIHNTDPNGLISVGPNLNDSHSWHWKRGINNWDTHSRVGEKIWRNTLKVNKSTINKYSQWLNSKVQSGRFVYSVELSSCVTHVSRALNASGLFNIGVHPYLLNFQMCLWSNGVRPWFICNYSFF